MSAAATPPGAGAVTPGTDLKAPAGTDVAELAGTDVAELAGTDVAELAGTDVAELAAYASRRLGVALVPESARSDDSGWDFRVVHIRAADGTHWILRRPRRPEAAARLAVEGAVLAAVRDRVDVPVPDWRLHTPELVAYPRLPGVAAGSEDPDTLVYGWSVDPLARPDRYLEPLARCLVAVHTTPLDGSWELPGAHPADPGTVRSRVADRLARARTELELPAHRVARWREWLDDDRLWPDRLVLVHGDVHPGHTLVEPRPSGPPALSGLLDWANAGVGDPAADFVDMLYAGGTDILDRLLDAYRASGGEVRDGMRAHVLARASFLWVHVALRGLDTGRPAWVETALRRLAR
ncbi:macrolide 2'-phosphotransferase [Streptomyces sp. b94]|uniref:macrolide 2'-phosphotransferase n=1 Tax=Streptomyces sp. b94 TaxID=1827634 RepID=UPI001B3687B5|nr:macrolide 2'-phosphotransferase [Streptomyces sp. b94]MBQ1097933.1 macrolide 2'-phosphotransferase [Streptomyces sp. b94]